MKIGKFQPSVAYKSVAYKLKSVYRHGSPACGILYGKNDYFLRENFLTRYLVWKKEDYFLRENFLMKNEKLLAIYFQKVVYNEKEEGGDGQRPLWIEERRKREGGRREEVRWDREHPLWIEGRRMKDEGRGRREEGTDITRCGLKEERKEGGGRHINYTL